MTTLMAQEIAEAPDAVARMLAAVKPQLPDLQRLFARKPSHLVTIARGSSDHAAAYFGYLCGLRLGLPCASVGPSVVSVYGARMRLRDCIVVAISQSGAGPDVLALAAEARRAGVPVVAVTNGADTALARTADVALDLCAGPEQSVAATKTFITSAAMAARIVAEWAGDATLLRVLETLPEILQKAARLRWDALEAKLIPARSAYMLGRGPSLPMAGEAALKLKETSGLHAEAFSSAEVIHGPMELVGPGFPVLMFAPDDAAAATNAATAERLRAAGADVHVAGAGGLDFARTGHALLDPVSMLTTFYGSAERVARARGKNPDKPRLLSKVTRTL